jgi:pilus assembly protein CpaE
VLCGAKTPQQAAFLAPEGLTRLLQLARGGFRYLLVDLGPGFTPLSIAVAEASERVYLTAMADGTFEVLHLKRTLEIMRSLEDWERRVSCVITRMTPDVRRAKQLEEQIGCPVLLIPNEYRLCAEAANNGRMAVDIGRSSALTQQIDRMAFAINDGGR